MIACVVAIVASTTFAYASGQTDRARTCEESVNQPQRLRISIVSGSSLEEEVLARALVEVETIWRPYQIEVVWNMERTGSTVNATSAQPDLLLQFVEGLPTHSSHAIAWVLFEQDRPLPFIRVSLAAAVRLLLTSNWFDGQPIRTLPLSTQRVALGRIIGRALAHEIGHVMLASRVHAKNGLMRAMIEPAQFVRPGLDYFGLERADVSTLHAAHRARCERARATLAAAVW